MKVLVVGARPAGLTCARELLKRGVDVQVLEADDAVGGRVRSDEVDGYVLDRGFQVLFTAYPAAKRQLDVKRLGLRAFDPGAIVAYERRRYVLTDPTRDVAGAPAAALSRIISPLDKLLTILFAARMRTQSIDSILAGDDMPAERYLRRRGFSWEYIDRFFRPFFGGIVLDRSLSTSAKCLKFDFKMLSSGKTVVPALGMRAIPAQLARPLAAQNRIRLNARVEGLMKNEAGAVIGVRLRGGETLDAEAVVLSVPAPEAARLSGLPMPQGQTGTVNLYWTGPRAVYSEKKLLLNANPKPLVNNAVQITNVLPEYAPPGRHLLSATMVGMPEGDDEKLFKTALDDLKRMFLGDRHAQLALRAYTPLKLYRIPYAQFAQPPGIHPTLPGTSSGVEGLYFAAEFTEASSINAAMISGEKAAELIAAKESS